LWTNYTYIVFDMQLEVPAEAAILNDHPNKSLDAKHNEAESWFDMLRLSQQKYLTKTPQQVQQPETAAP
jgi:hypothetical protein